MFNNQLPQKQDQSNKGLDSEMKRNNKLSVLFQYSDNDAMYIISVAK